eukprot:6192451-Pleurochrysis_carterae.AAC.8
MVVNCGARLSVASDDADARARSLRTTCACASKTLATHTQGVFCAHATIIQFAARKICSISCFRCSFAEKFLRQKITTSVSALQLRLGAPVAEYVESVSAGRNGEGSGWLLDCRKHFFC